MALPTNDASLVVLLSSFTARKELNTFGSEERCFPLCRFVSSSEKLTFYSLMQTFMLWFSAATALLCPLCMGGVVP